MATRDTPFTSGTPCWVELFTRDADGARAFYGELFGWEATEPSPEFGGYANFLSGGRPVAGLMGHDGSSGAPDTWTVYLGVDDAEATTAAAEKAGAQVIAPAMEVGPLGSMAVLVDPAGAAFGLWQAGEHVGYTRYNEAGSVSWEELHTKDYATALPFYADLFGWDLEVVSDTDDFRYTTGKVDGADVAGVMDAASFLPAEVPSHWAVYLQVDDADAAAATVQRLGGSVRRGPEDTPYGRLADVADPAGIAFKLHQPSA